MVFKSPSMIVLFHEITKDHSNNTSALKYVRDLLI